MSLKGQNLVDVHNRNLSVIIKMVKKYGPISRTELARETGLSNPAVGNLVTELLNLGLLKEVGSMVQGVGRSRVLLALNGDGVYAIGIEIARNGIYGVLANIQGVPAQTSVRDFRPGAVSEEVLGALDGVLDELIDFASQRKYRLIGIGIGTPGPVSVSEGKIFEPPNFPALRNIALKQILEQRYKLSCLVNDDARTSALAEAWFGAGQGAASLVFLSLGEGIGSGIIFNSQLYNGAHDIAGQIGHFTVDPHGCRCDCGNVGCLETLASIPAIARRAREMGLNSSEDRSDAEVVGSLIDAYRAGTEEARLLFDSTLDYIAAAVVSAINSYDPEIVIIGGRLVGLYPELVDMVKRRVLKRCYYHVSNDLKIVSSQLGAKTSALGGVTLVLQRLLEEPVATLEAGEYWRTQRGAKSVVVST